MKDYIKPEIELIELRPEERFAGGSGNCGALAGVKTCESPLLPSNGNHVP